ncbi:hypothetical protein GGF32_002310 [Allomyces javanicus]|nr:hypothetical protein GGF32_002310 [Allomyces javanicus]
MSDLDAVPTIESAPTDAAAVKLALDDLLLESHLPAVDATADAMTGLSPAEEAAVLPAQIADVVPRDVPASEEDAPDATLAFYRTADEETTLPFYAAEHANEDALSEGDADVTTEFADQTLSFYADVPEHGDVDATLPFYHPGTSPAPETRALDDEDEPQRHVEADDEVIAQDAQPVDSAPKDSIVDAPASDADVSADAAPEPLTAATLAYYTDASAAEAHLDQILLPGYATAGQDLFQPHVAGPSAVSDRAAAEPVAVVEESETAFDVAETVVHPVESDPIEPVTLDRSASIDDNVVHDEPSTPALAAATPIPPSAPATLDFYAHHDDAHDGEQVLLPEYATHGESLFSSAAVPRAAPTVTIPHPEIEHEDLTLAVYHHHYSADQMLPFYRDHHDLAAGMAVSPTSNSSSSGEVIHVDEVASMDGSGSGSGGGSWQIVSDDEDKDGAEEPVAKGGDVEAREAGAVKTEGVAADVPDVVDRDVAVEVPARDAAVQDEALSQAPVSADESTHDEPEVVDRSVSVDSPAPKVDAQDADEALPSQAPVPADEPAPTIVAEGVHAENDELCAREAAVEPAVAAVETERETEAEAVPPVEEIEPESLAAATPEPVEEPAEASVPATSADVFSSSEFQDAAEPSQEPEPEPAHVEEAEPAPAPAVARDLAVQQPTPAAEATVKTTVFVNTADQEGDIDITEGLPEPELVDAVRFEAIGATRSLLTQRRVVGTSTTDDHEHEADPLLDNDDDDEAASIADADEDELLATSPDEDDLPVAREPSAVDDLVTAMTTPTTPPSIQRLMHFAFAFLVVSMTVLGAMTYGMEGNLWVWFLVVVNVLLWYAVTQVAAFTNDTDAGAEDAPVDKDGVVGKDE